MTKTKRGKDIEPQAPTIKKGTILSKGREVVSIEFNGVVVKDKGKNKLLPFEKVETMLKD